MKQKIKKAIRKFLSKLKTTDPSCRFMLFFDPEVSDRNALPLDAQLFLIAFG